MATLGETFRELAVPIYSIGMVLAFAFVANYSGLSATLALALALEREKLAAQAGLVAAEAGGASWLQRNRRPVTMLSFLGLVVADAFGLLAFRLADQAWLLLQIGLGGYVVGRSVEKISPQINAIAGTAPTRPNRRTPPQAAGTHGKREHAAR